MSDLHRFIVLIRGDLTDEVRSDLQAGMSEDAGWIGIVPEWGRWGTAWEPSGTHQARHPSGYRVTAESPDQARERVGAVFGHRDGLTIGSVDRQVGAPIEGRYEEISWRAIEHSSRS